MRRPWKERKGSSPPASSSGSEDAALGNLDRGTAVGKCLWAVLRCVRVYESETSEIMTDVSSICTLDGAMW